jgi:hypothetical protein
VPELRRARLARITGNAESRSKGFCGRSPGEPARGAEALRNNSEGSEGGMCVLMAVVLPILPQGLIMHALKRGSTGRVVIFV